MRKIQALLSASHSQKTDLIEYIPSDYLDDMRRYFYVILKLKLKFFNYLIVKRLRKTKLCKSNNIKGNVSGIYTIKI